MRIRVMGTRYTSIGGKPNPQQPGLIHSEIAKMPAESEIIAATDDDADGEKLAAVIEAAVPRKRPPRFKILVPSPCPASQRLERCSEGPVSKHDFPSYCPAVMSDFV